LEDLLRRVTAKAGRAWCLLAAAIFVLGCSPPEPGATGPQALRFASFTATEEVYRREIIPAFAADWKARTGREVAVEQSYGPSGSQARAILDGGAADVAALSLEADFDALVDAGLLTENWRFGDSGGIASTSLVVIAVRPGNPKGIRDWPDLARPGLAVLTPDPRTSGGGRANVIAIYGAARRGYAGVARYDDDVAAEFLTALLRNVTTQAPGARESLATFAKGSGDAAITYESEAVTGLQMGTPLEFVVPRSTMLVENPIAVLPRHADAHGVRETAEAFVAFVKSPDAQRMLARYGFRPVDEAVAAELAPRFAPAQDVWRIGELGGWRRMTQQMFGVDGAYTRAYERLHTRE
jgi:sulfate/thiosulfate transport system substrate-binding protein